MKGVVMTTDRRSKTGAEMQAEVLEKLTTFSDKNRLVAQRMHELLLEAEPTLQARLWYGMPGYAKSKDSAVLCFFREDEYMTFGLTENAHFAPEEKASTQLMPSAWFFTSLDEATEQKIIEIVRTATQA